MATRTVTTAEAAVMLGVSRRRVQQLVSRGQVEAATDAPGTAVLRASVAARAERAPRHGRPWAPGSVWAAAWLRDGRLPDWAGERTLRRLRHRAALLGKAGLLPHVQPLAAVSRWAASPAVLDAVRAEAGTAVHAGAGGVLTVCLPLPRATALPARYGLRPGLDLVLVGTSGYRQSHDTYVPSVLL